MEEKVAGEEAVDPAEASGKYLVCVEESQVLGAGWQVVSEGSVAEREKTQNGGDHEAMGRAKGGRPVRQNSGNRRDRNVRFADCYAGRQEG